MVRISSDGAAFFIGLGFFVLGFLDDLVPLFSGESELDLGFLHIFVRILGRPHENRPEQDGPFLARLYACQEAALFL